MDKKAYYLPNLDGLRFIAASTVLIFHFDRTLVDNGYKKFYYEFFPFNFGDLAVVFFFVLSGFLITYLLLIEKQTSRISLKKFYLKRIFRIWPLYYLTIILAFVYFNNSNYFDINLITTRIGNFDKNNIYNIILLILIAPNIVLLKVRSIGYASPTWSIGVEEQFYLIWPLIIQKKNYLTFMVSIILIMFLLNSGLIARVANYFVGINFLKKYSTVYSILYYCNKFFTYWASFRIDAMAIGGLGAYMVVEKKKAALDLIFSKGFQYIIYLLLFFLLCFKFIVGYQFYSIVFMLMIINLSCNPKTIFSLNNKVLNYLGSISYGIYLYHFFILVPVIKLFITYLQLPVNILTEIIICISGLIFTILIASLSYHFFESYFLKLKMRFSK